MTLIAIIFVLGITILSTLGSAAATTTNPVVGSAGDIACEAGLVETFTTYRQNETTKLLSDVSSVLPLGYTQYNSGAFSNFIASYDPSWGTYKSISHTVIGNHENSGTTYYQNFGSVASITGTGVRDHSGATALRANSVVRNSTTFGVVKLTLRSKNYYWKFVPESGATFTDSELAAVISSN